MMHQSIHTLLLKYMQNKDHNIIIHSYRFHVTRYQLKIFKPSHPGPHHENCHSPPSKSVCLTRMINCCTSVFVPCCSFKKNHNTRNKYVVVSCNRIGDGNIQKERTKEQHQGFQRGPPPYDSTNLARSCLTSLIHPNSHRVALSCPSQIILVRESDHNQ
jgi:hypothetical protein